MTPGEKGQIKIVIGSILWAVSTIIFFFICWSFAGQANAQELNQIEVPFQHQPGPHEFYTHDDCVVDQFYELVDQATNEIAGYSVPFVYLGTHNSYARDGANTIGCGPENPFRGSELMLNDDPDIVYIDQESAAGTTRTYFYKGSGVIVETDVWVQSLYMLSDRVGLNVVRHELGHVLGVPHSLQENSLMSPTIGTSYWDIETIAKLSLRYNKCEFEVDERFSLWIPSLNGFYGIMPAGKIWPDGAISVWPTNCN